MKAVVTGGTQGIGRAIVDALRARGDQVVATGRNPTEPGFLKSDAANINDIDALAHHVRTELGTIDALFVNHGYAKLEAYTDVTEQSYDHVFAINTRGAFFTVQRLAPLINDGGSIVFTTSVADNGGSPGMITYSATKAALWSMAQGFAAELLLRNIRVNAVSPGFTATPSLGVDATPEEREHFTELGDEITPMRRHATPGEVATAALFLAFDATFTTGVKLPVDGGLGQRIS